MNKIIVFTIADEKNLPYATMLEHSFKKFHADIPFKIIGEKELAESKIPKPDIFYLATPFYAKELFKEYDCVIKIDADSIVTGNLDHIFINDLYDVATVLNWNRVDPQKYGEIGLATIQPQEYFNNGFVVMRNKQFVEDWWKLCQSPHYPRMPFREQGFLNILCHYGQYAVHCLDYSPMWHGLVSKGEWNKMTIRNGELVLPKGQDNYPQEDKIIKVIHWAGGAGEAKMNYKVYFQESVIKYIDDLIK